eukprot:15469524-Alexandrium_andersonii.AAC.1
MDYAEEDQLRTLLVIKHRQSRAVRCWVVPAKGALDLAAAEAAERGIRDVSVTGEVILKSDNEDAINALRARVSALRPGSVWEQTPAAYEHESNGVIENGNRLGKGLLRVLLLSPEAKVQERTPCGHLVFAWLTEYIGDVFSKHLVGKDALAAPAAPDEPQCAHGAALARRHLARPPAG